MAIVRLEAMRALRTAILAAVPLTPALEIVTGQPGAGKRLCLPSLAIRATRFSYHPDQEQLHREPSATTGVYNVGYHEAAVQLRLYTATPGERYSIEEKVLALFLGTYLHPGVLLTPVTAVTELGQFLASWELEEDEWQDEKAFDNERGSMLTVTAQLPALITRAGDYQQEHIHLGLTHDFAYAFTPSTLLLPAAEVVEINEDGTISAI